MLINKNNLLMNRDKKIMLTTAFVSALCVVWAVTVPAMFMAAALVCNTLFCLYVAIYKFNGSEK